MILISFSSLSTQLYLILVRHSSELKNKNMDKRYILQYNNYAEKREKIAYLVRVSTEYNTTSRRYTDRSSRWQPFLIDECSISTVQICDHKISSLVLNASMQSRHCSNQHDINKGSQKLVEEIHRQVEPTPVATGITMSALSGRRPTVTSLWINGRKLKGLVTWCMFE